MTEFNVVGEHQGLGGVVYNMEAAVVVESGKILKPSRALKYQDLCVLGLVWIKIMH